MQPTGLRNLPVYIIEDDDVFAFALSTHLSKRYLFKPQVYNTPDEALKGILNDSPVLIFLDYYLFDKNGSPASGEEIFTRIKQLLPDAKVIVLSAQDEAEVVFNLIKLGVRDYISKAPGWIDELEECIGEFLRERQKTLAA